LSASRPSQLPNDDSSDDNGDGSGPLNYVPYSPKMHVSCLVTARAVREWTRDEQAWLEERMRMRSQLKRENERAAQS